MIVRETGVREVTGRRKLGGNWGCDLRGVLTISKSSMANKVILFKLLDLCGGNGGV